MNNNLFIKVLVYIIKYLNHLYKNNIKIKNILYK